MLARGTPGVARGQNLQDLDLTRIINAVLTDARHNAVAKNNQEAQRLNADCPRKRFSEHRRRRRGSAPGPASTSLRPPSNAGSRPCGQGRRTAASGPGCAAESTAKYRAAATAPIRWRQSGRSPAQCAARVFHRHHGLIPSGPGAETGRGIPEYPDIIAPDVSLKLRQVLDRQRLHSARHC